MVKIGSRVRREGRDDLGVGEVMELHVGEMSGHTARVNWDDVGYARIVKVRELIDVAPEAARGSHWLSDG